MLTGRGRLRSRGEQIIAWATATSQVGPRVLVALEEVRLSLYTAHAAPGDESGGHIAVDVVARTAERCRRLIRTRAVGSPSAKATRLSWTRSRAIW